MRNFFLLVAALALPNGLAAQNRADSLAILKGVARGLFVKLAKPGAEGHLLIAGTADSLRPLAGLVDDTLGQICADGVRVIPDDGVASVEITRFAVAGDTALVRVRSTHASLASGTDDLWRFVRGGAGGWSGAVLQNGYWEKEPPASARGPTLRWCRGTEPGGE